MTGKRLLSGSAAIAVAALVGVSGVSAFDGHRGGGGSHLRGEGNRMGSGFSGLHGASPGRTLAGQGHVGGYGRGYGVTTGRTVAGQGYAGRYAGKNGRYGHGRYGVLGAGIGLGLAGGGWGYPGDAYHSGYDGGYPGYAYASGYDWGSGYSRRYPGFASTWGSGACACGGHFTSGTAGAW